MIKNLFKKFGREDEPEELDTGYDSGYYGGPSKDGEAVGATSGGYEEPEYRAGREYAPAADAEAEYRHPKKDGYYEEDTYVSRGERAYTRTVINEPVNKGTLYFRPEFYSDKRDEMVEGLADSHVVMVSMNRMDSADRMRLVDYLMGAVCALKGEVAYRNGIFAMTPKGVELDEADYELLEDEEAAEDYGYEDEVVYAEDGEYEEYAEGDYAYEDAEA